MKMLREPAVLERMAMRKTAFHERYVATGRVHWVRDGRMKRLPEHEVDRLIREDCALAQAQVEAGIKPKPAFTHDQVMRGTYANRKKSAEGVAR